MPFDVPPVAPLDADAAAAAAAVRGLLPVGSLGVWGSIIDQLAAARGSATPPLLTRPHLVVFAADHDVAELELSAAPSTQTMRRAEDLATGQGLAATLAEVAGVGVTVVDAGMAQPSPSVPERVAGAHPAARIDITDAMDNDLLQAALEAGRRAADREVDSGTDLLIGAVCGVGVSTPVAALTAALTGMEPVDATSRGSGIDDAAWIRKAAVVRDALFRIRQTSREGIDILRTAGGPDLAALTGFTMQAAVRRTPVIIHDMPSTLAAVLAHRLAPGVDGYLVVSSLAPERGHGRLLDLLGRGPLTDWSVTGHSGVGALLMVPALTAAARAFDSIDRNGPRTPTSAAAISSWDATLL